MIVRRFAKCSICGSAGHGAKTCSLADLNKRQEFQLKVRQQAARMGLQQATSRAGAQAR